MITKNNKTLFLFLIIVCTALSAFCQEKDLLIQAQKEIKVKNYEKCIELYSELLKDDLVSADLYYNLGLCYYHKERIAESILNFERALKMDPRHDQAFLNLKIINEQRATDIIEIPDFFLKSIWSSVALSLSILAWTFLFFIFLSIGIYYFKEYQLSDNINHRKRSFWICLMAGVLLIFCLFCSLHLHKINTNNNYAINLKRGTIFAGPDNRSDKIQEIFEGEKLKLLDVIDDWSKVQLLNKEEGWIRSVEIVEI